MSRPLTQAIISVLSDFGITDIAPTTLANYQGHLTNDSRTINQGDIFCAIIGHAQDGRQYIEKAIANGAKLVLSECDNEAEHGKINSLSVDAAHVAVISFYQLNKKLFALASAYYQNPQKNMTMIGITGTNGKTSTSQLLGQLLTSCQKPCAIIGTNGAGMVDDLQELENTTPSATELVQLFAAFSQQKFDGEKLSHLAMEVSSHALEQSRVTGSVFDIAVFTNLSRDHLDYHGTMADYAAAKRQLFTHNSEQIAVLNGDDAQVKLWLENWSTTQKSASQTLSSKKVWLYGRSKYVRQQAQFVSCHHINHHSKGVNFTLHTHLGDIDIRSPLLGDFNIDNLLAVVAILLIEGIALATIAEKTSHIKAISGRMESFSHHNATTAVVDYAHTPDALEKALIACRQHCHGTLTVVFGCGGDRDKGKRPLMAQVAQKHADCLVITNDNPRTEAPMGIINDILSGLSDDCQATVIVNRKQAVLETLSTAQTADVVLLAGKGHEDYIILGENKINYNERQVVKDFFENIEKQSLTGEQL
ncbi:MAG: UDP-N-acetylmuramoyl-L-alanyl-D-glutamate--2,6-diaminopimelate ligase [Colwellia sp.]|nr:UDP-N-acetylmuramoyl-L-alanyl-D-glutamate--2,6-diaminopimelate ligase [Colwellia sp.]